MTTEQIAVVTTGVVGVAGILAPTLTAWRQRVHEIRLARAERTFQARSEAYADAARLLRSERLRVERTLPVLEPMPDPPAADDEEWARVVGRLTVHASTATLEAFDEVSRRVNAFRGYVLTHQALAQHEPGRPDVSQQMLDARIAAQAARERVFEALDEADRVMRDELDAL